MKRLDINKIQVTNPCATDWQGMTGDDKTRFCNACNKRVYNLSAMTRREVEALVRETNGRFCARMMRDTDGSIITATENTGLNLIRLRASKFASAVMTAALSLSPLVTITANANPAQQVQSEKESKRDLPITNAQGGTQKIYGTVYDINGAVIIRATITLTNEKTKEQFVTTSSEEGTFQFNAVPAGTYGLKIYSLGFVTQQIANLELQPNIEKRIDVTLQVGATLGEVVFTGYFNRSESLDTNTVPDSLLQPIKAIQLFINKPNKEETEKKKKNQK
jgi:hypothetical protein